MENPHAERQAVLLQRIHKNVARLIDWIDRYKHQADVDQDKCTEIMLELNHCVEEILRANAYVKVAADLHAQHRKNIQYNLNLGGSNSNSVNGGASHAL